MNGRILTLILFVFAVVFLAGITIAGSVFAEDAMVVDFARKKNASFIIKGLRAVSDFEYECQMALANKNLAEDVETLFMTSSPTYSYLSSSIVKELAKHYAPLENLVPDEIVQDIYNKYKNV